MFVCSILAIRLLSRVCADMAVFLAAGLPKKDDHQAGA